MDTSDSFYTTVFYGAGVVALLIIVLNVAINIRFP